jgi:hypothetical protein
MKIAVKTTATEKVYATPEFWNAGYPQRVEEALALVNGRAQSFTVTTYGDVRAVVRKVEERLDNLGVSKKNRVGAEVTFTPSGPGSNSYKYAAITTRITLIRTSVGWFLTSVARDEVYPNSDERLRIALSRDGCEQIVAVALRAIGEVEKVQVAA